MSKKFIIIASILLILVVSAAVSFLNVKSQPIDCKINNDVCFGTDCMQEGKSLVCPTDASNQNNTS